ncbi:MAG: hypothetical protein PHT50_03935 [Candidatus Omnitrophica bacterium]|nr:hypothetical protein [Candidatus Omnitrophota bacterium]
MRKTFLVFIAIVFCFLLTGAYTVSAQEKGGVGIQEDESDFNIEEDEMDQDPGLAGQQLQAQKQAISQHAQAAKAEEAQLKQQIKAALDSGDMKTAQQIREKLRLTHQENLQEKMRDMKNIQESKQDLRNKAKETQEGSDLFFNKDRDNNPPGPKGGPGTNWENPPGPKGGPGAGLDGKPRFDRDNNPPGPKGGPGTNWENPPGPKGGPGAGPAGKMVNPPGPKGGPGAGPAGKMVNPPGPKGGPGVGSGKSQGGAKGKKGS